MTSKYAVFDLYGHPGEEPLECIVEAESFIEATVKAKNENRHDLIANHLRLDLDGVACWVTHKEDNPVEFIVLVVKIS